MKFIRIASDLHLEFRTKTSTVTEVLDRLLPANEKDKDSFLVLAGDISNYWNQLLEVYDWASERFPKIFHVPGNHEYYGQDMMNWSEWANEAEFKFPTVSVGNQEALYTMKAGELALLGTTLWATGGTSPVEQHAVSQMMDFRAIRNNRESFTRQDMENLSRSQVKKLEDSLENCPFPAIVVTHHLPSMSLCDKKYSPSLQDGLFASNYDHLLVGPKAPKFWICGHTHTHIDKKVGDSWVIANPAGYPGEIDVNYVHDCFIDLSEVV